MGEEGKASWLVRDRPAFQVPRQKKAKQSSAEDEDILEDDSETIQVMKSLIVQLEARVRLLEHESMSTAMLDRKHQIVTDCNKSYQEIVKTRKQDPNTDLGSPACQAAYSILVALKTWPYKDTSARISKLKFATDLLTTIIKNTEPEEVATWIKEAAVFPTYDKPGQPQKSRFIFKFLGQVLVPDEESDQKEVLEAADKSKAGHPLHLHSPLECTTSLLQIKGTMIGVEVLIGELVHHSGGKIMMSKAPRGNLARMLMPKRA